MRLTYHPEAETEAIEAAQFYETRAAGLGAGFLDEYDAMIAGIQEHPERWRIEEDDIRRCLMRRFPYGIYYRFLPGEIRILAVKHHGRHPDYWKRRISE